MKKLFLVLTAALVYSHAFSSSHYIKIEKKTAVIYQRTMADELDPGRMRIV